MGDRAYPVEDDLVASGSACAPWSMRAPGTAQAGPGIQVGVMVCADVPACADVWTPGRVGFVYRRAAAVDPPGLSTSAAPVGGKGASVLAALFSTPQGAAHERTQT